MHRQTLSQRRQANSQPSPTAYEDQFSPAMSSTINQRGGRAFFSNQVSMNINSAHISGGPNSVTTAHAETVRMQLEECWRMLEDSNRAQVLPVANDNEELTAAVESSQQQQQQQSQTVDQEQVRPENPSARAGASENPGKSVQSKENEQPMLDVI